MLNHSFMGTAPPQWVRYRVWDKFVKKTNFYNKTTITELKYKNRKMAFVQRCIFIKVHYQYVIPCCGSALISMRIRIQHSSSRWIRTQFRFRIHGFDDQKVCKISEVKNIFIFCKLKKFATQPQWRTYKASVVEPEPKDRRCIGGAGIQRFRFQNQIWIRTVPNINEIKKF